MIISYMTVNLTLEPWQPSHGLLAAVHPGILSGTAAVETDRELI